MSRVRQSPFPTGPVIEKIIRLDDEKMDDVETGPSGDLSPAFSPIKPRLEQLYAMPNLEDYLSNELEPSIFEASLLLPNRFNQALRLCMESLAAAEEEDPRNAHLFRRARKLMNEQAKLRDLVQMYRSALLKG